MLWGLLFLSNSIYFSGAANPNPREEEIRLKVLRRGLEVDMPEQTPGKQKSGWKCFGGVWPWTCQIKPPGSRNQAESASAGFGGGHARANPREAEIRLKVRRRGLKIYKWIGRHTNELGFRFFLENNIYEWIGRYTMVFFCWKIYEWIGRHTNELGFRFFWGRRYTNELEYIRMNWGLFFLMGKIYEWIGRYTNELGFRFSWGGRCMNELEYIRMNWGSIFFGGGRHTNELEDRRMNWGSDFLV